MVPLALRERVVRGQHFRRHGEQTEVVEHAGGACRVDLPGRQGQLLGDAARQLRHHGAVSGRAGALDLDGRDKGTEGPLVGLHLGPVLGERPPGGEQRGEDEQRAEGADTSGYPQDDQEHSDDPVCHVGRTGSAQQLGQLCTERDPAASEPHPRPVRRS